MIQPGSWEYRSQQREILLQFGVGAKTDTGFGYLGSGGKVLPNHPEELYITCRMTYIYSLSLLLDGTMLGSKMAVGKRRDLARHGVESLLNGPLRDEQSGGWYASTGMDRSKAAYAHAFVLLAAATAKLAEVEGANQLLSEAIEIHNRYFWDESAGMSLEQWDSEFGECDNYRGINSNMHTVEALLAVGDATGEPVWHRRAMKICERVRGWAAANHWRIPEHYDVNWRVQLEYNRDKPADPFRPYGATIGHGLEWARLFLAVSETEAGCDAAQSLQVAAVNLVNRAVIDGWAVDGNDGFIYTCDWAGQPVTRARMHWVMAEAIAVISVLRQYVDNPDFALWLEKWWRYTDKYLVDHQHGSWFHELDSSNRVANGTWEGKPDIYHAYQASLIADLPLAPSFAGAALACARGSYKID